MKIIRAVHLGMCFGVRDAIALALRGAEAGPVTVLGELVHNETVLAGLRARGVVVAERVEEVTTRAAMITAHGASRAALARARAAGLEVAEATCPLVRSAHRALEGLVAAGFHPVIIGRREHVEVRGMTGDLADYDVVLTGAEVDALRERPRFGVVAHTTQPIDRVEGLVRLLRRRFPASEVRFADTVCRPTKERQEAAVELARAADVVIVVGGARSNNTRELAATCRRDCARVWQIETAGELRAEWVAGAGVVGVTAGTSTPDRVIDEVEARLREWAAAGAPGLSLPPCAAVGLAVGHPA